MILDLLSNRSNVSLIKELRQQANDFTRDVTLEIQREVKIQRIFDSFPG